MTEVIKTMNVEACFHKCNEGLFFCHFPHSEELKGLVIWGNSMEEIEKLIPKVFAFVLDADEAKVTNTPLH